MKRANIGSRFKPLRELPSLQEKELAARVSLAHGRMQKLLTRELNVGQSDAR